MIIFSLICQLAAIFAFAFAAMPAYISHCRFFAIAIIAAFRRFSILMFFRHWFHIIIATPHGHSLIMPLRHYYFRHCLLILRHVYYVIITPTIFWRFSLMPFSLLLLLRYYAIIDITLLLIDGFLYYYCYYYMPLRFFHYRYFIYFGFHYWRHFGWCFLHALLFRHDYAAITIFAILSLFSFSLAIAWLLSHAIAAIRRLCCMLRWLAPWRHDADASLARSDTGITRHYFAIIDADFDYFDAITSHYAAAFHYYASLSLASLAFIFHCIRHWLSSFSLACRFRFSITPFSLLLIISYAFAMLTLASLLLLRWYWCFFIAAIMPLFHAITLFAAVSFSLLILPLRHYFAIATPLFAFAFAIFIDYFRALIFHYY